MVSARRAGFAVPWIVVGLLGFWGVAPVGKAMAIPSLPAVGMPPAQGIFSGFTSQPGNGNQIMFRPVGLVSAKRDCVVASQVSERKIASERNPPTQGAGHRGNMER